MSDEQQILDRLIEACATGGRSYNAGISLTCLGQLTARALWRKAAERILELDTVHPRAQDRFLDIWMRVPFRQYLDDDLCIAVMRKILPPYGGGDARLLRGQVERRRVEMSWTRSPHIALKFALFGADNIDPIGLALKGVPKVKAGRCRENAVVLQAMVRAANIICAPCLLGRAEGEFIVDPRGIEFTSQPAADAAIWIKAWTEHQLAQTHADKAKVA